MLVEDALTPEFEALLSLQAPAHSPTADPGSPAPADWSVSAILFADLVESVRLMERDELGVIQRWRQFVSWLAQELLPACRGRMVKSLGDGVLLEFGTVHDAVSAAHRLHAGIARLNQGVEPEGQMLLRVGVHLTRVLRDATDLYGSGVNLGARIAASAKPGQTVISASARSHVVPRLDGAVQDLGECYLKNVEGTHRLFALTPPAETDTASPSVGAPVPRGQPGPLGPLGIKPRLAVAPVRVQEPQAQGRALGYALTDHLISALARSDHWTVTSRLSIGALGDRRLQPDLLCRLLDVQYLLVPTLEGPAHAQQLRLELHERDTHQTIWSHDEPLDMREVLSGDTPLGAQVASALSLALLQRQLRLAHKAALPTLAGYTLFLAAISRLHSLGRTDMDTSLSMLEHLVDRHPRAPEARVWLAKWHFLQVAQVAAADLGAAAQRARAELDRARDLDPDHALAWALSGHLDAYIAGNLADAERKLLKAQALGPNESLTALFLAQLYADTDRGEDAVRAVDAAQSLSPLDPMRYYYLLFAASAYSAAGRHEQALVFTRESLQLNAMHLSTWVQLIIDLTLTGQMQQARDAAQHYLVLRPAASVARYRDRHAGRGHRIAERNAQALVEAGLPW